ncbi:unnamed protein product [Agarophyton chilense]
MARQPPALGADDDPPSPLPPPTPYTEPPTPVTMPNSPLPNPSRPHSPRLRPLRRLAARRDISQDSVATRPLRRSERRTRSNSASPAPPPSAPVENLSQPDHQHKEADTPPASVVHGNLPKPATRSSSKRPPQPEAEPSAPDINSDIVPTQTADQSVSDPAIPSKSLIAVPPPQPKTVSPPSAAEKSSTFPDKSVRSDSSTPDPMIVDNQVQEKSKTQKRPSEPQLPPSEPSNSVASEHRPSPLSEQHKSPKLATRRLALAVSPLPETRDDHGSSLPKPPAAELSATVPSNDEQPSSQVNPRSEEDIPNGDKEANAESASKDKEIETPAQTSADSHMVEAGAQAQDDIVEPTQGKLNSDQSAALPSKSHSSPMDISVRHPISVEVEDLVNGASQPTLSSLKPPRPRQLAVRTDFNKSEHRQLAVRTPESQKPARESSGTPMSSSPDVSKLFRNAPISQSKKPQSSPEDFEMPVSKYETRSATKERQHVPMQSRGRRQSEPANTVTSDRKRRRKPQSRPVKGDRLRVLWHIDLLYYEGVVDSVLSYRGKQFYDITYDSGEREYYLDLTTRKWRFSDGRDGNESDDSILEHQQLQDYSAFPKVDDKIVVMWHVDGKYYPGTVQDILKTSNGWFYDVGYEGGDREFFLDLHVRKWKYGWEDSKKKKPRLAHARPAARRGPREKVKQAARKSTGGSIPNYIPPTISPVDGGASPSDVEAPELQPSRSLRKVESLLEEKERQEQGRRAEEEEKKKITEQKRKGASTLQMAALDHKEQMRTKASQDMERNQESSGKPLSRFPDSEGVIAPKPYTSKTASEQPRAHTEMLNQQPIIVDLSDLGDETFENVMQDIDAPLAPPYLKKRTRSTPASLEANEQIKRTKKFSSAGEIQGFTAFENLETPSLDSPLEVTMMTKAPSERPPVRETNISSSKPLAPVSSSHQRGQRYESSKRLPPNAAPPARKSVQQRARSAPRAQPISQHVLQSEPDFIPRPRAVSRARSRSRRPSLRRQTASPSISTDRRRLMSRGSASAADYTPMNSSAFPSQRLRESRKNTNTTVADIVSVSGLVAKKWIEENTKQFSINLNGMENELRKLKANHAKYLRAAKTHRNRATAQESKAVDEEEMSDGEKDAVLGNVRNEFMSLIRRYRGVVEQREQVLIQQFARFRKTLSSQNSELVSAGKELGKLDIRGLEALDNLHPVTRKKLDTPPPVPPREQMNLTRLPTFKTSLPLHLQHAVEMLQLPGSQLENSVDRPDKSEAVAKSLRRKLADLVTRSDWLSEEVKRLQTRERFLVREKREALAELSKVRVEKGYSLPGSAPTNSRGLLTRSATARATKKSSLKFAPSKPLGIVKNKSAGETRVTGRNVGKATRKSLPLGNLNYKPPAQNASTLSRSELKSGLTASPPLVLSSMTRSSPMLQPSLTPMPSASRPLLPPRPTAMENVTKPPNPTSGTVGVDRETKFAEVLGKSMDKQVSELLSLIYTIWLLQDEGRSEPPKQPGDKMDSWVMACVRNCLKHARTYLDATSGLTTARRSLMNDVDGENICIQWILGDSDASFEKARSNYSLWEPTLLDVEWLAEKRVLVGLSICYKKAWEETSARQYETTLMYAKAIAHKAVANFELYMPHTIVLGPTPPTLPSVVNKTTQLPQPRSNHGNLEDQQAAKVKESKLMSGPNVVSVPGNVHGLPAADPSSGHQTAAKTGLPLFGSNALSESLSTNTPMASIAATSKDSSRVVTVSVAKPMPGILPQPTQSSTRTVMDVAGVPQSATLTPGSTDLSTYPAQETQPDKATSAPRVTPPISAADLMVEKKTASTGPTDQRAEKTGIEKGSNPAPSGSVNEIAVESAKVSDQNGPQIQDETREKHKVTEIETETAIITGKGASETRFKPDKHVSQPKSPLLTTGCDKSVGNTLGDSKDLSSQTPTQPKSDVHGHQAQVSPNEVNEKISHTTVLEKHRSGAFHSVKPGTSQLRRAEDAQNSSNDRSILASIGKKLTNCSPKETPVSRVYVHAAQADLGEGLSTISSQETTVPQSNTVLTTSIGSNPPGHTTKLQTAQDTGSSKRNTAGNGTNISNQHQTSKARTIAAEIGQVNPPPVEALTRESDKELASSISKEQISSKARTTGASDASAATEKNAKKSTNDLGFETSDRSLIPSGSQTTANEILHQSTSQTSKSRNHPAKRGSRSAITKSSGTKTRKQLKTTRNKTTSGKSRTNRTSVGRPKEPTGSSESPRNQRKGVIGEYEAPTPITTGMIGMMRLPGASPTVPQVENRTFVSSPMPADSVAMRQPVGMKRLPQMPASAAPQRRILSGVDVGDFESLPSPIPRRQGFKGSSDDAPTQPMAHVVEQQGNPYVGNGRWPSQQPVSRKGYKSLSLMPPLSQHNAPTAGQSTNPFDARAVASPFEYNRNSDQGIPNEPRPEVGQESGYHVVDQVDVMNPPTPAALSALDYTVEQTRREPLPSTQEFQERFDRGNDPYRSQIGHIMNSAPMDGVNTWRNVQSKKYGKR